jgi:hypothetical protein
MRLRYVFIAIFVFILLASGVYYAWYQATYHTVSFKLKTTPMTAKITKDGKEVAKIDHNTSLTLANGSYLLYPAATNIDTSAIGFTVDGKDTSVTVDPPIDSTTLSTSLDIEIDDIQAAIVTKYPQLISQFYVDKGQLLRQGDWYISTLTYKSSTNNNPKDRYKIILQKTNGQWAVVGSPQIVPTVYNFPKVPTDVVKSAYELLPERL